MTERARKTLTQSQLPSLWLDSQHAWQQSEDAVIIPINYRNDDSEDEDNNESVIIPVAPPIKRPVTPSIHQQDTEVYPTGVPNVSTAKDDQAEVFSFSSNNLQQAFTEKTGNLSVAVPLLLLGVIALVVFAWLIFR